VIRLGAGTDPNASEPRLTESDIYRRSLGLALAPVAIGLIAVAAIAIVSR